MPATKNAPVARKNAKKVVATKAPVAPAKQAKPVPAKKEAAAAAAKRTAVVEAHVSRNEQGRIIQSLMNGLTVAQIVERTGYSESRVLDHVNYELSKGRSKMKGKTVVVISEPIRRNAS